MTEAELLRAGFYFFLVALVAFIIYLILSFIVLKEEKRLTKKDISEEEEKKSELFNDYKEESLKKQATQIHSNDKTDIRSSDKKNNDVYDDELETRILEEVGIINQVNDDEDINIDKSFLTKDVREIVIGKNKMLAIRKGTNISDVLSFMIENNVSHCPVYHRSIDDILGVIKIRSILKKYLESNETDETTLVWDDCVEMPPFISGSISIINAFSQMRLRHSKIAIVIDEYAHTIGIITEQDIIDGAIKPINEQQNS